MNQGDIQQNQWIAQWESTTLLTDKWVTTGERHFIDRNTLILITDGQAIWSINGEKVNVTFGHLIAIEEDSLIEVLEGGNLDLAGWHIQFSTYSLFVKERDVMKFEWHVPAGSSYQMMQLTGGALASVIHLLSTDAPHDGDETLIGNQHLVYGLLKYLYQKQPSGGQTTEQGLYRSVVYMQEHYDEVITRKQLAEIAGISQWYYSHKFSEQYNKPPLDYLANYRIYRAQEELLLTSARSHEIGKKVGFEDAHYFSRRFKQFTGVSPRNYTQTVHQRKILSLSPLFAEILMELGIIPQAVVVTSLFLPQHQRQLFVSHQVELLEVSHYGFDLELIQQVRPELIVGRFLSEEIKQQLRTIGPLIPGVTEDISVLIDQFAAVFNRQNEAAKLQIQMKKEQSMAREQLQSIIQSGATVMVLRVEPFGYRYLGEHSYGVSDLLYQRLGLAIPEPLKAGKAWFNPCSIELLQLANPDYLFVEKRVMEYYSANENVEKLLESSKWKSLRAVKENRVYDVDTSLWVDGYGITGHRLILNQMVSSLLGNIKQ